MQASPLFLKLQNCTKRYVTLQGGGDAGKTVAILQRMTIKNVMKGKRISTVNSRTIPAARAGALRTYQRYVVPDYQKYINKYNETERTYTFYNRSILEFKSHEDELAATGSERDDLFSNECNHESYQTWWQLQRKTRDQVFSDYNPTSPFWMHDKVLPLDQDGRPNKGQDRQYFGKVQLYITDHRHNPYLSDDEHEMYETISDPDLFRVYSRGLTGKIKGLIFGHFKKWDDPFPIAAEGWTIFWCIDYGYTNDPTALLKIAIKGKKVVAMELSYAPGISAETINALFYANGYEDGQDIYSEADPNMVNQLRLLGLPVQPAIKGPGSIAAGISKTKEYECWYTADSKNFEKEILVYKWIVAQDVISGKEVMTNQPIDAWNHCCDAFRMGLYTYSFRNR